MSATHGIGGDPEDALRLAERGHPGRREAAGAGEAEALVVASESALTRFANSRDPPERRRAPRCSSTCGSSRAPGRRRVPGPHRRRGHPLARRARRRDRRQRRGARGLARPPDGRPAADAPRRLVRADRPREPGAPGRGRRAVIAAADEAGVTAFGSFSTDAEAIAVANTKGIRAAERRTTSQLLTVTMGPDNGTGYAEQCAVDATMIDAAAIGREAAERARTSANPVDIEPGDYPVVLHHYAVVDLARHAGLPRLLGPRRPGGPLVLRGGKRVASPLVTITDDGRDPAGLPMGFDAEGVPKQRLSLIDEGVCRDARLRRPDRGTRGPPVDRPRPAGPEPVRPVPDQHGHGGGDASFEELVGGLDRGLLVTRFHYTNPVHGSSVIITGMTRDGTFLVEGGKVVGPVRNLRFTMSYLDALANVEAVSRERRCIRGFLGGSVVPSVRAVIVLVHRRDGRRVADALTGSVGARRWASATAGRVTSRSSSSTTARRLVDVGARAVPVDATDLERILDRLAADGGTLRLLGGTGRADDGDEPPDRESDPAMGAAGYVLALAHERGLEVISGGLTASSLAPPGASANPSLNPLDPKTGLTPHPIAIYRDAARYHASHQDRTHPMFQNHPHTHGDPRRHRRDPRRGPDGSPFGFRDAFGGGRGRGGMVRRGEIRPLILAVLARRPMHGYEVITALEAQSGGRWRPSAGSVYPTLQQLSDEGLVTSEEIDGRRVYTLTDEGKAAAAAGPRSPWADADRGRRQRHPPPRAPGRRGGDAGAASRLAQRRDRGPGDPARHARQAVRPARRRLGDDRRRRRRRRARSTRPAIRPDPRPEPRGPAVHVAIRASGLRVPSPRASDQ